MQRFWIILTIVILGLVGVFILSKPKDSEDAKFDGKAQEVQQDDHVRGERDNKVTLIEYADFQCPSCGSYFPTIKQLEQKYGDKVTFIFRHYPIISLHPNAFAAARASEAASKQGKFFDMHDKLFETQSLWGQVATNQQSLFEGYAKDLGLNLDQFKSDYTSETIANRINRDVSSAKQFNITGTPSFVINGNKITTPANSVEEFSRVLDKAIKDSNEPTSTQKKNDKNQ